MQTSPERHSADKKAQPPQVVPYIAQWSAEDSAPRPQVVMRRGRIAFVHERRYDRDADGTLWARVPFQPGKGTPQFGRVHALRQRNAMERLLCHVCGGPADRTSDGVLWLLTEELRCPPRGQGGDVVTEHPPLCLPCARIAIEACPRLRRDFTAVRVRAFERAGVWGALYRRAVPHPVPVDVVSVAFDDPVIDWVRAGKLLLRLTDYQPVDLYAETHVPADERGLYDLRSASPRHAAPAADDDRRFGTRELRGPSCEPSRADDDAVPGR